MTQLDFASAVASCKVNEQRCLIIDAQVVKRFLYIRLKLLKRPTQPKEMWQGWKEVFVNRAANHIVSLHWIQKAPFRLL